MNALLLKISLGISAIATAIAGFFGYVPPKEMPIQTPIEETNVGVALPGATAVFETSLASPITSSATSMTLTANSVRGGGSLSGFNCFTIDEGSATAEFVCGTISSTVVSSMTRGISPSTGTTTVSALQFAHRRGSNVKITDFPLIQRLKAQNNGEDTFPNLLTYTSGTNCSVSSDNQTICEKSYIDGVSVAGASNANDTTKGIVEMATNAEAAAGTSVGGTAARLALGANLATSTYNSAGANQVVVTGTNNKIDQNFLNLNQSFTFNSTTTFASTTITGLNTMTDNATINLDWSLGNTAYVVLGGSRTFTFTNVSTSTALRLFLCQDGTGSRTVTWPSTATTTMRWATGFAPVLTTTANKCDIISLITATTSVSVFGAATTNF